MNNNNNNVTKLVQRGQIWYANLNGQGSVQNGGKLCVIISNKFCNTYSSIISCIPLTSKTKKMLPTHVLLPQSTGLNKESTILCEQVQTIDKSQLGEYIGIQLNEYYIQQIERALMIQLGIEFSHESKQVGIM